MTKTIFDLEKEMREVAAGTRPAQPNQRSQTDTVAANLPARLTTLCGRLRAAYNTRPISAEEWDAVTGDES